MKVPNYLVASTTLLLVAACSQDEPAAPPRAETSLEEGPAGPPIVQTEGRAPAAVPKEQDDSLALVIGEKAPAFELKDQNGQNRSLADILESGNTALIFYRSADW